MGIRIVFPEDEYEDDGQMLHKSHPELWIGGKNFRIKSINSFGDDTLHIEFVIKGSDIEFGKEKK
jgi:hypothetical protein